MTRDGLIEVNETQQTAERISSREADSDFSQPDSAAAERVIEHLDAAHTRKANKKEVKKEQEATALRTSTSRLQFTEEERATPELETYIKKSEKAADRLDAAKAAIPKQQQPVIPPRAGSGYFCSQQNPQRRERQFRRGGRAQIGGTCRARRKVRDKEIQTGLPQP